VRLLLLQVHIICREALADCPSCAPALDTLAQYYLACACLAAQHLAALYQQQQQHEPGQGEQVKAQQQLLQALPAGGQAAGEQHEARPQQQSKQPATSSHTAAAAAAAVEAACSAALQVLDKLLIADGIRAAYWRHRRREVEEVLAACSSLKGVQEVP
jgi:hypothetical protein